MKTTAQIFTPPESVEFDGLKLGLQWQWMANPEPWWYFLNSSKNQLRFIFNNVA
ncbi:MAG: hypothetical protein H0V30_08235 [Chitinophagaceae bacterium]|nr:hypothetical protein [Chitinophagaceae bacterium]